MPAKGFGDAPRTMTMGCAMCDVTWRGNEADECWSCGDAASVTEATPRRVRYSPATADVERLVG